MRNRQYNVTLQTPIGERYGRATVTIENNRVGGILDILKEAVPFHGIVKEDGSCFISGKMVTLMHTIVYEATGRIEEESLHLTLKAERNVFELSGTAVDAGVSGQEGDAR